MSRSGRLQAYLAFDVKSSTSELEIPISVLGNTTDLPDYLSLQLANKEDSVLNQGMFGFKIQAGVAGITNSDYVNLSVEFYRDKDRKRLIYKQEWQSAGITLANGEDIYISIPIQYNEIPLLTVMESTAKYYVSVIAKSSIDDLAQIYLEQYCFSGMEIA